MISSSRSSRSTSWLVSALLLFSALLLALLITGTFAGLGKPLRTKGHETAGAESVAIASQFYDAINETIASGNSASLKMLLSPHYFEGSPEGVERPDGPDLLLKLQAIRTTTPQFRLGVDSLVPSSSGDRVTVWLHVESEADGIFLGQRIPTDWQKLGWGPVEILYVDEGHVSERRVFGSTPGTLVPLFGALLPVSSTCDPRMFSLIRMTIAPATATTISNGLVNRVMFVESGHVTVVENNEAEASESGYAVVGVPDPIESTTPSGITEILPPGTTFQTQMGDSITVINSDEDPANLLLVSRYGIGWGESDSSSSDVNAGELAGIDAQFTGGITIEVLTKSANGYGSAQSVEAGRVILDPGGSVKWSGSYATLLLAAEDGEVIILHSDRSVSGPATASRMTLKSGNVLSQGETSVVAVGEHSIWTNVGLGSASLIVLSIRTDDSKDRCIVAQ